jgi:hypothetical protein
VGLCLALSHDELRLAEHILRHERSVASADASRVLDGCVCGECRAHSFRYLALDALVSEREAEAKLAHGIEHRLDLLVEEVGRLVHDEVCWSPLCLRDAEALERSGERERDNIPAKSWDASLPSRPRAA